MKALGVIGTLLLLTACSSDPADDVPPLPKQNAETANELMREAEQASANAEARMEQEGSTVRSEPTTNEVHR